MPQLYTPFLADATANITGAIAARGQQQRQAESNQLFGQAYMGDQQALQQLSQVNPQLAVQAEQKIRQRQADDSARAGAQQKSAKELDTEVGKTIEQAVKFDDYGQAASYIERRREDLRPIYGDAVDRFPPLTEENYEATKEAFRSQDDELKGARIDKIRAEIEDLKSDKGTAKEALQIEKLLEEIKAKKTTAEEKRKTAESKKLTEVTESKQAVQTIDDLLAGDVDLIYGSLEYLQPDFLRSQEGKNMLAKRDQISSLLELAAAGKLKGQGGVSEGERSILKESATMLKNQSISAEQAEIELRKARDVFLGKLKQEGVTVTTQSQFDALPSGSEYIGSDGKKYRKP